VSRAAALQSALARVLGLGEAQLPRAARLVALVFLASSALVVAKAAQSAVFLAVYTRAHIPWAFAASALTLASLSALSVAGVARLGQVRTAKITLAASAVAMPLLAALLGTGVRAVAFAGYVVIESIAGLLLIQVWSLVSAAVDPRTAKTILPVAGVGASVAWTVGGLVTPALVRLVGARGLLLVAPALVASALAFASVVAARDMAPVRAPARPPRGGVVAGWRRGFAFVLAVPLLRVAMLLGVVALATEQLMDFELMSAARERCASPGAIAAFYGRYYGITSAIGMILSLGLSGRVLSRFGAPFTLALTPAITFVVATVAAVVPGFATIVALRATDRVLKQSIWTTSMEQVQTPIPPMQRTQSRAVIRGVVGPLAYGALALVLAALPETVDLRWLAGATAAGTLAMAIVIGLGVRRSYVRALQRAIDDRRLVLDEPGRTQAPSLDREACRALEAELRSQDEERAIVAAELLSDAEGSEARDVLERAALPHRLPEVRVLALEGLARLRAESALGAIAERVRRDEDARVRLEAVRALRRLGRRAEAVRRALEHACVDEDARVRALAKVALAEHDDPNGVAPATLVAEMLASDDRVARTTALGALRRQVAELPEVQRALADALAHEDLETRLAALRAVASLRVRSLLPRLSPLLEDPRTAPMALAQLGEWGDDALRGAWAGAEDELPPSTIASPSSVVLAGGREGPLARLLSHPNAGVREGTTRVLGRMVERGRRRPLPRSVVEPILERELARAYSLAAVGAALESDVSLDGEARDYLLREVRIEAEHARRTILRLLALAESRRLARAVEAGLRRQAREAHVAELLEMTLRPELAARVVPLFEPLPLAERAARGRALRLLEKELAKDAVSAVVSFADAHVLGCAMIAIGAALRERARDLFEQEARMIPVYERMRFLRRVPLFDELPGDDLRQIAAILEPIALPAGHVIFEKGEPGEDLYVIATGEVAIRDGAVELARLSSRDFFGELAVLDREPRSAAAVCVSDCELLRLGGADLGELMARRPQIKEEILQVLVRRVRELSRRLAV
jgi:CRP/FNR family cyclic AMP-dependent transcriptional regulator